MEMDRQHMYDPNPRFPRSLATRGAAYAREQCATEGCTHAPSLGPYCPGCSRLAVEFDTREHELPSLHAAATVTPFPSAPDPEPGAPAAPAPIAEPGEDDQQDQAAAASVCMPPAVGDWATVRFADGGLVNLTTRPLPVADLDQPAAPSRLEALPDRIDAGVTPMPRFPRTRRLALRIARSIAATFRAAFCLMPALPTGAAAEGEAD